MGPSMVSIRTSGEELLPGDGQVRDLRVEGGASEDDSGQVWSACLMPRGCRLPEGSAACAVCRACHSGGHMPPASAAMQALAGAEGKAMHLQLFGNKLAHGPDMGKAEGARRVQCVCPALVCHCLITCFTRAGVEATSAISLTLRLQARGSRQVSRCVQAACLEERWRQSCGATGALPIMQGAGAATGCHAQGWGGNACG